jgi:phospholipase C
MRATRCFVLVIVASGLVACGERNSTAGLPFTPSLLREAASSAKIKHVVIVIQENRSFDNLFATFPGADGTTTGEAAPMPSRIARSCASNGMPVITKETRVALKKTNLFGAGFGKGGDFIEDTDLGHIHANFHTDRDSGKMDGFDLDGINANGSGLPYACTYPYQYVDPTDIAPYWDLAKAYVLADHTFQTQSSGSFTAHQDLIAGGTQITSNEALIDNPSYFPWGCDAKKSVVTAIIKRGGKVYRYGGPWPCLPCPQQCLPYTTMRDLLDAKSVAWKFYANKVYRGGNPNAGDSGIWSGFDAIAAVRNSKEWGTKVVWPDTKIFNDIENGALPSVSWVTPDGANSDHPDENNRSGHVDNGPSWVASIVNAIGESKYWNSTAVIVLWDDWGGFYDHVPPPTPVNWQGTPGFRVPMLIVSPYVKPHVDHTVYEFGSILRFIEDLWNLPSLGKNDADSTSIENAFDFTMSARAFHKIGSTYSQSYFLHQQPSGMAPDTE